MISLITRVRLAEDNLAEQVTSLDMCLCNWLVMISVITPADNAINYRQVCGIQGVEHYISTK